MTTSTFLHFGAQTRRWTPPSTCSLPIGSDRNRFEVVGSISSTTLTTRFSCEARETLDRRLVFVQGFDRARHPVRPIAVGDGPRHVDSLATAHRILKGYEHEHRGRLVDRS